jgi:hypothetical protein
VEPDGSLTAADELLPRELAGISSGGGGGG